MLADNIATTHPFVQEESCKAGQAHVSYPVAAQRLKLQGQRFERDRSGRNTTSFTFCRHRMHDTPPVALLSISIRRL